MKGCVEAGKGETVSPYGTCILHHLQMSGALSSRAGLVALLKQLKPYERAHDPAKLPRFVRAVLSACVSKLSRPTG